jgi:hypothetical protein
VRDLPDFSTHPKLDVLCEIGFNTAARQWQDLLWKHYFVFDRLRRGVNYQACVDFDLIGVMYRTLRR